MRFNIFTTFLSNPTIISGIFSIILLFRRKFLIATPMVDIKNVLLGKGSWGHGKNFWQLLAILVYQNSNKKNKNPSFYCPKVFHKSASGQWLVVTFKMQIKRVFLGNWFVETLKKKSLLLELSTFSSHRDYVARTVSVIQIFNLVLGVPIIFWCFERRNHAASIGIGTYDYPKFCF